MDVKKRYAGGAGQAHYFVWIAGTTKLENPGNCLSNMLPMFE